MIVIDEARLWQMENERGFVVSSHRDYKFDFHLYGLVTDHFALILSVIYALLTRSERNGKLLKV